MRFCMLSTFYPPYHFGGDGVFVQRLSQALAERGHHVDVYHNIDAWKALATTASPANDPDCAGVRVIGLESGFGLVSLVAMHQTGRPWGPSRRLHSLFEPGRYDVIHIHNPSLLGAPEVLTWAKRTEAVTLYTAHDHWLVCPMHVLWRNRREACERQTCLSCQVLSGHVPQAWRYGNRLDRALEAMDAVLAPSRFSIERHRAFGLQRDLIHLPHFCPDMAAAAECSNPEHDRPYFLYSGRLEALKGPQALLDVFRSIPWVDLVIAGDGSLREQLRAQKRG